MSSISEKINRAASLIAQAKHLVVFTGAGISTESGLPDYRGPDGVWTRRDKGLPPPKGRRIEDVSPNRAHKALVKLQEHGKLGFLISQNVDNLHLRSGIDPSLLSELHGNCLRQRCITCEITFPREQTPKICSCGGARFKSSVINFGDNLPTADFEAAWEHSEKADVYLVIGSTLLVTPASDLPAAALDRGAALIILNLGETPLDGRATLHIKGKAGEILPPIVNDALASLVP